MTLGESREVHESGVTILLDECKPGRVNKGVPGGGITIWSEECTHMGVKGGAPG